MALDRKKLIKASVLILAFIISIALFAAVYTWYKKREKKKLSQVKDALEKKWMGKKDVFGIGTILDKYIEILVGTEQVKAEIEKTLDKGKSDGIEVKVVVGKQPEALKTEKKPEPAPPVPAPVPAPAEKVEKVEKTAKTE